MRNYVITTGTVFGLVAVAHFLRTIMEWSRAGADPFFLVGVPGLGIASGAVAVWAWRLLRAPIKP